MHKCGTRWRKASVCPSVHSLHPSVYTSRSGIVSKRLNIVELHHATTFQVSATNRRYETPTGSPVTEALHTGGVCKFEHLLSYSPCSTKVWSITSTMFCLSPEVAGAINRQRLVWTYDTYTIVLRPSSE